MGGVGFKGDFRYYFSFVANGKRRFCPPRVVAVQDAPNETSNSKMPPKTQTGARISKYQPAHLPCLDGKPPSFGARSSAGKRTNLQLLRTNNTFPLCLHTSNVDNAPPQCVYLEVPSGTLFWLLVATPPQVSAYIRECQRVHPPSPSATRLQKRPCVRPPIPPQTHRVWYTPPREQGPPRDAVARMSAGTTVPPAPQKKEPPPPTMHLPEWPGDASDSLASGDACIHRFPQRFPTGAE